MNGRTLLNVPFAVALAAAAFAFTENAAAQGETPPATPAPAPSGTTTPAPAPATPAAAGEGEEKKESTPTDDTKKKAQTGDAAPAGVTKENDVPGVSVSLGGESAPRKDEIKVDAKKGDDEEESRNPFTGSILFWDHSVSTQTARTEWNAQQSYQPLYEWWFSFQPRYYFNKRLSYRLRADYTKELTNTQDTTSYREGVFGDVWNTLRYETPISERLKNTKASVSGTIKLPLSKESQAQGVYFKPSVGVGLSQKITINGESAKWFPSAGVSGGVSYEKPILKSTTASSYGNFETFRQDTEGRTFVSDQLTGGMLKNHTVLASLRGDLQISEKWSTSLSMIFINNWLYTPKDDVTVRTDTGMVSVPTDPNASSFQQSSWIILGTDYDVIDEMSVGLGYYNLAGIIGPNGQRRGVVGSDNIWWSPSARIFGTITANLDKLYDRAAGIKKKEDKKTGSLRPVSASGSAQ